MIPVQPESFNMGSVLQILKNYSNEVVIINSGFTNVEIKKIYECCCDVKIQLLVLVFTEFCNVQNSQTSPVVSPVMVIDIFPRYVTVFTKSSNLMSVV